MNTFLQNLLSPVFAGTSASALAGSSVEIAADAASQAVFDNVLREGVSDGSIPPPMEAAALLAARPWRRPTLLQPRAEVAEPLKSAAALAQARRSVQAVLSPDGRVYAASGRNFSGTPPTRQTSLRGSQQEVLETFQRKLNEAKAILKVSEITIGDYRSLLTLFNSIPTAAQVGEANLWDKNWRNLILETATTLVATAARGLELRYNDISAIEHLVKRAMADVQELVKVQKKNQTDGASSAGVLEKKDQEAMKNVELALAWQKIPLWARRLVKRYYRNIKVLGNPGALELGTKLMESYGRRKDFFRVACGLMGLSIASKEDPNLDIVRLVVFKQEFVVDNEPAGKVSPLEIQATHEWKHTDLPRGVKIHVWGPVPLRPRF